MSEHEKVNSISEIPAIADAMAAEVVSTADLFGDPEWDLIGLVCDQLDRANPDLPIEDCQAIARDIIKLVRGRT
jgi:hypothetical protein